MMALTRETVDFRGHYFKYFNVPIEMRPYQKPHPPLWYATGSEEGAAWAGSQNHNVAFLAPDAARQGSGRRLQEGPRFQQRKRVAADRQNRHRPASLPRRDRCESPVRKAQKATRPGSKSTPGYGQKYDPRPPPKIEDVLRRDAGRIITGSPQTMREEIARQLEADRRQLLHHPLCLRQSDLRAECPLARSVCLRGDAALPEQVASQDLCRQTPRSEGTEPCPKRPKTRSSLAFAKWPRLRAARKNLARNDIACGVRGWRDDNAIRFLIWHASMELISRVVRQTELRCYGYGRFHTDRE